MRRSPTSRGLERNTACFVAPVNPAHLEADTGRAETDVVDAITTQLVGAALDMSGCAAQLKARRTDSAAGTTAR